MPDSRPKALKLLAAAALLAVPFAPAAADSLKLQGPAFEALYKAAVDAKEDEVVYYTAARTEEAKLLSELWKENFPQIGLKIVGKKAPDLITQVEAEKAAGGTRNDVATMTQPYVADLWKKKGYYEPYKVSSFDKLGDYADKDGAYYSTGVFLLPVAYNDRSLTDRTALPHTLNDFLDPKWKGKIAIAHPGTSGNTLTFFLGMMQLGKIDWSFLEKLAKQNVMFVRGAPDALRAVASGERVISPVISSFNVLVGREGGQSVDFYGLDEGTMITEQPTGIMAGAPHPNAAKLLLEVLTSVRGQELQADAGKYWPTNIDAKPSEGMPKLADFKLITADLSNISDEKASKDFLKRFDQTFGRE